VLARWALPLLVAAALALRVRDLRAGFDASFAGHQGAFFALASVAYERLPLAATWGYPAQLLDLPAEDAPRPWPAINSSRPYPTFDHYLYVRHPPLVPLAAWASVALFAPRGWSEAWREGRAPRGIEPLVRAPFLLAHVLGLLAFHWMARRYWGARAAACALALYACLPVAIVFGAEVNYENASLPCAFLALGAYATWLRTGSARARWLVACCFAAGAAVTYAPLCYAPPLVAHAALARGPRAALPLALAIGAAALVPCAAQALLAHGALEAIGAEPGELAGRPGYLLAPLLSGATPPSRWLAHQTAQSLRAFGAPVLAAACIGLALAAAGARSRRAGAAERDADALLLVLAAGAALYALLFYYHTAKDQLPFLLYAAPTVALACARALAALRLSPAQHALAAAGLAACALVRWEGLRAELRPPPAAERLDPEHVGARIAELAPPGALVLYPEALDYNLAQAWYAWRNLVPTPALAPLSPSARASLAAHGGPVYALLPREGAAARAGWKGALDGAAEPTARNAQFELHALERADAGRGIAPINGR
jgi:hypothetical protein